MDTSVVMVAAIDFGTTYSGYAYSFYHDYKRDPLKISANSWISGNLISMKTPSTILLTPNKKFHSFGYEAEDKYASLAEDGDHKRWLYFRRFKMILHKNKSLTRATMIKDDNGKEMPAKTIFTMAIKYLKDHLMETIIKRVESFEDNMIRWILTVPAIWDDGAKQFMRLAAQEAGIKPNQLLLSLEPEAASIYCNRFAMQMSGKKSDLMMSFRPGTKYIVLDLGGGTADITVHEVKKDGKLREISKATGGAWGGTKVDDGFYQFLVKLFGNDVLMDLKDKFMDDYLSLMRDFEIKKRIIHQDKDDKIMMKLPLSLMQLFKEQYDETLAEALPHSRFAKSVAVRVDKIQVQAEVFKEFFSDAIHGILEYTNEILKNINQNIEKILLVGGFSESAMVYQAFKSSFPDMTVTVPADAGLAVLKGAVLYGHEPDAISSRITRFTYGLVVTREFVEGVHPELYKMKNRKDEICCDHLFEKYVEIDSEIPDGHRVCKSFTPDDEDAVSGIGIFKSTCKNPVYTTDSTCTKVGSIVVRRPNGGWNDDSKLHITMEFGRTEFSVSIRDDCLDDTYTRSYDFLQST